MIGFVVLGLLIVYFSLNVYQVAKRNQKAHQFFKLYAPDLPALDNPKLFSGHLHEIVGHKKGWKIVDELHKKLGPSFGHFMCEQPWIATKDLDLLKKVHIDGGQVHINKSFLGIPYDEFCNSVLQLRDQDWRRARQAVSISLTKSKVFNEEVTKDFSSCVKQLEDLFERRLDEAERKTGSRTLILENTQDVWERFSLSVVLLAAYKQENLVDFKADKDRWVTMIRKTLDNMDCFLIQVAMMFPFLKPFITLLGRCLPMGQMPGSLLNCLLRNISMNRSARRIHAKVQEKLKLVEDDFKKQDFSMSKSQSDFRQRLADSLINFYMEKKITYTDLKGNLLLLVLAGFETTANTGSLLFWFLARHPEIQTRLRREISQYGLESEYLLWCILETVRYQGVIPFGGGRILAEDVTLNGRTYPKGAYVLPSVHSIHHDPDIWPNPDVFDPERWSKKESFHPAAFVGFGLGARNCVGYQFAIHELKLALQMFLANYKLEKCEDTVDEYNFASSGIFFSVFDDKIKLKVVPLEKDG